MKDRETSAWDGEFSPVMVTKVQSVGLRPSSWPNGELQTYDSELNVLGLRRFYDSDRLRR